MTNTDAAERRTALATPATRRCGTHYKGAATHYLDEPRHLTLQFGKSFGSISDPDMVDRIEREVENEAARIQSGHPLANPLTLDECVSALIAARWARRFGNPQATA